MSIAVLTDRLLPQRVDNTYRGYKLALWLFGRGRVYEARHEPELHLQRLHGGEFRRRDPP